MPPPTTAGRTGGCAHQQDGSAASAANPGPSELPSEHLARGGGDHGLGQPLPPQDHNSQEAQPAARPPKRTPSSISLTADGSGHGGRHYFQGPQLGRTRSTPQLDNAAMAAQQLQQREGSRREGSRRGGAVWMVEDGSAKGGDAWQPTHDSVDSVRGARLAQPAKPAEPANGGPGGGGVPAVGGGKGDFGHAVVMIEEADERKLFDWGTYFSSLPKKLKGARPPWRQQRCTHATGPLLRCDAAFPCLRRALVTSAHAMLPPTHLLSLSHPYHSPGGLDTRLPVPSWRELFWSWLGAFLGGWVGVQPVCCALRPARCAAILPHRLCERGLLPRSSGWRMRAAPWGAPSPVPTPHSGPRAACVFNRRPTSSLPPAPAAPAPPHRHLGGVRAQPMGLARNRHCLPSGELRRKRCVWCRPRISCGVQRTVRAFDGISRATTCREPHAALCPRPPRFRLPRPPASACGGACAPPPPTPASPPPRPALFARSCACVCYAGEQDGAAAQLPGGPGAVGHRWSDHAGRGQPVACLPCLPALTATTEHDLVDCGTLQLPRCLRPPREAGTGTLTRPACHPRRR